MNEERVFHKFPELPKELREEIWTLCLPFRVYELDEPRPEQVFYLSDDDDPVPCQLTHTSHMNGRPPLISQVCHESRTVAYKAGSMDGTDHLFAQDGRPKDGVWGSQTSRYCVWLDPTRDSPHLNYVGSYEPQYASHGSPLGCLLWIASGMTGAPSIMLDYIEPSYLYPEDKPENLRVPTASERSRARDATILGSLPYWPIVMKTVVIHADLKSAAATGLFGLLGDAPIQIVEVSDSARLAAYQAIAEENEHIRTAGVTHQFNDEPTSTLEQAQLLKDLVVKTFKTDGLPAKVRPAIMFRLCTRSCDRGT